MRKAFRIALMRGFRTSIQALSGVALAVPAVNSTTDAHTAAVVATWGAVGAAIAGVATVLQNFSEQLEVAAAAAERSCIEAKS